MKGALIFLSAVLVFLASIVSNIDVQILMVMLTVGMLFLAWKIERVEDDFCRVQNKKSLKEVKQAVVKNDIVDRFPNRDNMVVNYEDKDKKDN